MACTHERLPIQDAQSAYPQSKLAVLHMEECSECRIVLRITKDLHHKPAADGRLHNLQNVRLLMHAFPCRCSAADCENSEDTGQYIEAKDEQDADNYDDQVHFKHFREVS